MPPPDAAVAVLDGAFLVRCVGPCVVDLRPEGPVQAPLAGGFAPVVGGHRADDRQRTPRPHPPDCPDDAVLADGPDALGDVAPAAAVDHHYESPAPATPRDDGEAHGRAHVRHPLPDGVGGPRGVVLGVGPPVADAHGRARRAPAVLAPPRLRRETVHPGEGAQGDAQAPPDVPIPRPEMVARGSPRP